MRGLADLRVLVTGAAGGIGLAVARRLAAEGARVALADRRDDEGFRAEVRALEGEAIIADLSRRGEAAGAVREARARLGGLDALVNNAGRQEERPSDVVGWDAFDAVRSVGFDAAFEGSQEAIRGWLAEGRGGAIVSTTSVHEWMPKPGFASYATSKAALGALTRTLALEYARHGIRVNAVAPGGVDTPMNAAALAVPGERERAGRVIPLGRLARPEEVAGAFAWLLSEDAAYVTGATVVVDGGLSLQSPFAAT